MLGEIIKNHKSLATPDQIDLGVRFFDKKEDFGKSANFRVVFDNSTFSDNLVQQCHASMPGVTDRFLANKTRALIATDNASLRAYDSRDQREEVHGKYLNWLTKEAFFAPFFLSSGDLHETGFIISSDIPTEIVQFMLLGTRAFLECTPKGFSIFNDLYDKYGGDVAAAVVTGTNLSHWGEAARTYPYDTQCCHGDDIVVFPRIFHNMQPVPGDKQTLTNYLSRQLSYTPNVKKPYRVRASVYGSSNLFGKVIPGETVFGEFVQANKDVKNEIKKARKGPIEVVKNPFTRRTPFAGLEPSETKFRWSEIRDIILPEMQAQGYFNV